MCVVRPLPLRMLKFRKLVVATLLGGFSACVAALIFVHLYHYSSLPRIPDEKVGRTYRMEVNNGSVRYGSEREFRALETAENCHSVGGFLFLGAAMLGLKWGIFHKRGARQP